MLELSKYFQVSIDYILGNPVKIYSGKLDHQEEDINFLLGEVRNMCSSDRKKLIRIIEILHSDCTE